MQPDLSGRTAVVTGAGRGLGFAIARDLARAGARLCLLDVEEASVLSAAETLRREGAEASAVVCDVADPVAVATAAQEVAERLGGCDVLVNNAGIVRSSPLEDLTPSDWRRVVSVNLDGCFHCTQSFGRMMLSAGGGSIVNIASVAAINPSPGRGAYSATKSAILGLTRQAAVEWGPRGVRVNAVCPGLLTGPMGGQARNRPASEAKQQVIPLGRLGALEEIAAVVTFLASDQASYVSGATFTVDGALTQGVLRELQRAR